MFFYRKLKNIWPAGSALQFLFLCFSSDYGWLLIWPTNFHYNRDIRRFLRQFRIPFEGTDQNLLGTRGRDHRQRSKTCYRKKNRGGEDSFSKKRGRSLFSKKMRMRGRRLFLPQILKTQDFHFFKNSHSWRSKSGSSDSSVFIDE